MSNATLPVATRRYPTFFVSSVACICILIALSSGTKKKCNNYDKADFVDWIVCMWNEFTWLIDHKLAS